MEDQLKKPLDRESIKSETNDRVAAALLRCGTPEQAEDALLYCARYYEFPPNPVLTEAMIDAPRGFLMGLELGVKDLTAMRRHLDALGEDYSYWPEWARTEGGHLTKAAKAILVWTMMEHERSRR